MNRSIWEGAVLSDPETRAVLGDALLEREEFGIDALRWRLGIRVGGYIADEYTDAAAYVATDDANADAWADTNVTAYADGRADIRARVADADAHVGPAMVTTGEADSAAQDGD